MAAASRKHESGNEKKTTTRESQPVDDGSSPPGTPTAHNGQVNGQKDTEDSVYEEVIVGRQSHNIQNNTLYDNLCVYHQVCLSHLLTLILSLSHIGNVDISDF